MKWRSKDSTMTKLKVKLGPLLKAFVFIGLLVIFYVFYLKDIIKQFNEGLVNTSKFEEKVEKQAFPTLTVCPTPSFKEDTLFNKYNSTYKVLFWSAYLNDEIKKVQYEEVWNDAVYQLDQDYRIQAWSFDGTEEHEFKYGLNSMFAGKFNVKRVEGPSGLCTVLEPLGIYLKPTKGFDIVIYNQPENSDTDDDWIIGFDILMTSQPLYYLDKLFTGLPGVMKTSLDFKLTETQFISVFYDEALQTYVKGCSSEKSVFQDFAQRTLVKFISQFHQISFFTF